LSHGCIQLLLLVAVVMLLLLLQGDAFFSNNRCRFRISLSTAAQPMSGGRADPATCRLAVLTARVP